MVSKAKTLRRSRVYDVISTNLSNVQLDESKTFKSVDDVNKLASVFHASVLLVSMNFVITLSKQLWISCGDSRVDPKTMLSDCPLSLVDGNA